MTSPQLVRELGPIIDKIDFQMPAIGLPAPKNYTPKKVSASGIKNCERQWFYTLSQHTRPYARENRKPEWDLAAAQGTWIHDTIQQALIEYGLVDAVERYLPDLGNFLSGRIDGVLTNRRALLEIKTMGADAWRGLPDNEKFAGYQDQIQAYLEVLDLPEALLVGVRREPIVQGKTAGIRISLVKEFVIQRDREEGQRLLAKSRGIKRAVDLKVVPPGDGVGCIFCPFQQLCRLQDVEDSLKEGGVA